MPREEAIRARSERNAALVEIMMLAAAADGQVSQLELQALLRRVMERPEFEGTRADELNALIEGSVAKLSTARTLDTILKSLRERLPDHKTRMLGFGLAAAVAFADQRATPSELGLLKTFQAALGISEDEVARIVEVVQSGGSLADALGEPLERLYAEVMVLVTAADGKVRPAEAMAVVENFAADPAFREVSPERAQAYISESVTALTAQGLPDRMTALAQGLTTHAQRKKAFRLAWRVASAGGGPSPHEAKILELLQATFGLADDEVERIRKEG
jgi:tellurite resistance protein